MPYATNSTLPDPLERALRPDVVPVRGIEEDPMLEEFATSLACD
jgi:hypothetical protein